MKPAALVDVIAWNAVSLLCPTHASSHADARIRPAMAGPWTGLYQTIERLFKST
jgi:hypothetical protein